MPIKTLPLSALNEKHLARFWSKVDKTPGLGPKGGCWLWTAAKFDKGYGAFRLFGAQYRANRIALIVCLGADNPEQFALHTCDVPACCNPTHLYWGDHDQNMEDMYSRGRGPVGDRNGKHTKPESRPRGKDHWRSRIPELVPKGTKLPFAKLTEAIIPLIRRRARDGESRLSIAASLNVSGSTIARVLRGEMWKHVP